MSKISAIAATLPDLGEEDINEPLTEMQQLFVKYYVESQMTQTAAARAAGFNHAKDIAPQLMKNAKVAHHIQLAQAAYARASRMSRKKVVDGFLEAIEMAKLKGEPLTMVAGWREVGKICGLYEATKTKVEISVDGKVLIERMSALSDEELLKIAQGEVQGDVIDNETGEIVENVGDDS